MALMDFSDSVHAFFRKNFIFPRLVRQERLELVERVEQGADGGVDYCVMMVLSTGLASLGLLQGSVAVIIGAMLVAPLMGPLIGAGLALVQGNAKLFSRSLAVTLFGMGMGFAVAFIIGLLNPGLEPSVEIEARGTPDLLDLGVALFSGFIAAYALGRTKVANTLAGVAIAAALVPPLAVVAIGLTNNRIAVALNSGILLLTNVVAIILAAALAFKMMGIRSGDGAEVKVWVRQAFRVFLMLSILLLAPLMMHSFDRHLAGADRPLSYPVSQPVEDAVMDFVEEHPELGLIVMARDGVGRQAGITVLMVSKTPVPSSYRSDIIARVRDARKENSEVRVFFLLDLGDSLQEQIEESEVPEVEENPESS